MEWYKDKMDHYQQLSLFPEEGDLYEFPLFYGSITDSSTNQRQD